MIKRTAIFSVFVLLSLSTNASSAEDSTSVYRYELLYRSRIELERSSVAFPWNDPEAKAHLSDRLAGMVLIEPYEGLEFFFKGATGERAEGRSTYRERFFLDQGHVGLSVPALDVSGLLFLRERVFRSTFRLVPLLSNETEFTEFRGEGAVLEYFLERLVRIRYIGSLLRDDTGAGSTGGVPRFQGGGDVLHSLELDLKPMRVFRLGLAAEQVRSIPYGDSSVLAAGVGIELAGVNLTAELAQSVEGRWDEFDEGRLFGIDLGNLSDGSFSSIFSGDMAFSAELNGLGYRSPELGSLFLVPGYRFSGTEFRNTAGETGSGIIESYITAWWKHPVLDMLVSLEARDSYHSIASEGRESIHGSMRARLKGGFDAHGSVIHIAGRDPALVMTLLDENPSYRISASARIDSVGGGNTFSFLSSGSFNLTGSLALRSWLYLYESTKSLYSAQLEFRPREAFLFAAGFGSFYPYCEDISFHRDCVLPVPEEERMITVSARIWFGNL